MDDWNTSVVTDMSYMFSYANAFNQPIGGWNTAAVTDMSYMFSSAYAFNQPIGGWNTSAVTDMSHMFEYAEAFNQSMDDWNTSAVADMDGRRLRDVGQAVSYGWVFAFAGLGVAGMRFRRTVDQAW